MYDKKPAKARVIASTRSFRIHFRKHDWYKTPLLSVRLKGEYGIQNICLSIPAIAGIHGVENFMLPDLNEHELNGLHLSAQILQEAVQALQLH